MKVVGLMSGTSADGVDAALVDIRGRHQSLKAKLVSFSSLSYPRYLQRRILDVSVSGSVADVCHLNALLGEYFAKAALKVIRRAKSDDFISLGRDIAMHIAASNPRAIKREDIDQAALAEERDVYQSQAEAEGKPAEIIEKIVDGKLERYLSESVLYEQAFVKDPDQTVGDLLSEAIHRLGENIIVGRFVRFAIGESDTQLVSTG